MTRWPMALLILLLAACGQPQGVRFHENTDPADLAEWGVLHRDGTQLQLAEGVIPYELATPLFTDHASKLRTIWMPPGKAAAYNPATALEFPVGTILSKTFYYPLDEQGRAIATHGPAELRGNALDVRHVRLIETRLLVRRETGWVALPYVWNPDGTAARLKRIGGVEKLTLAPGVAGPGGDFAYVIPSSTQCGACHVPDAATKALAPIGPTARSLNIPSPFISGHPNQLHLLADGGQLSGLPASPPANAVWTKSAQPLEARARAYLDVNCGHCHSATGPARTSGLHLDAATPLSHDLGLCKPPVAAGQGTGDRQFDIVPGQPERSILIFRMQSLKPNEMMPEIGRTTAHAQGIALISSWIAAMKGSCTVER
ncbi:hypothetical protein FJQ54_06555 [Sandaracinobacter neustonicus]|uniref:Cytochrome c domain-containing protein n=1 Tax=Sandaracinobacter neustonicus TaxID=1715348 RepID=A0A501XQ05_9SPHN|nr:SO2930 family diheme c-type cytochrome [Sandaracinobacter neustonicus]TPE62187.1 hypothetical protein FJQ54_06555 [Sandaracinobacter neustonicus]